MKAKYVQEGKLVDYVSTAAVAAGDIVIQGDLIGIAAQDIPAGTVGALTTEGVFCVEKTSAATFAVGAKVYWNVSSKTATATTTDTLIGVAVAAAAADDQNVLVKIG